jgi:hypothetical protein
MNIRTTLLLTILLINSLTDAQTKTCDCGKDFDFLATSYIKDYSGFNDFSKLHPDCLKVIDKLSKQAKTTKGIRKCDKIIGNLIKYLNNGHVQYGTTQENPIYGKEKVKKKQQGSLDPSIKFLDSKTVLFQIKSADLSYKSTFDSLINLNKDKLDVSEHFIIDLRGNGGGGDAMFSALIPYMYTNPILIHSTELWASENNIKMFENLLSNPDIPKESKEYIQKIVAKGRNNFNNFISISENKTDTITLEIILKSPIKISVIIDKECISATEQFLLLAKQSKKTTIYGYENSGGALDYSNLNVIFTPSKLWYASIPTTRTTRLPDNPIDPNGIKPDELVDKKIKDIIEWLRQK